MTQAFKREVYFTLRFSAIHYACRVKNVSADIFFLESDLAQRNVP